MKYKLQFGGLKSETSKQLYKKPFLFVGRVFLNTKKCYVLMPKFERIISIVLLSIAFLLIGYKSFTAYTKKTVFVPANSGIYTEALVGDVKYLNPVLAQSDAEKSISSLLFSGLVRIDETNQIVPDLAEKFEVSENGQQYTFYLKKGVVFNDGQPLTANDVAYTVDLITSPELKSPMQKSFDGVTTEVIDDSTIVFDLPKAYGPFLYNCTFGIVPSGLSSDEFSKSLTGTGQYKFDKFVKKETKIKEVHLTRNDKYFGEKPYLDSLKFILYTTADEGKTAFENDKTIFALFGADKGAGVDYSFQSSRRLGLVANIRSAKLSDKAVRQQIFEGTALETNTSFTLATLDLPAQQAKAREIKQQFVAQNIDLNIQYLSPIKFQESLAAKDFDFILYGFDFSRDRDPYIMWHSSQKNALNLSGYSDKNSDILLEDARMMTDAVARNAKYDQFFQAIEKEFLVKFYDPIKLNYFVKSDTIKGVEQIKGVQPCSRFEGIAKWYSKEKRVRK